jgi:fatty acid desaturase
VSAGSALPEVDAVDRNQLIDAAGRAFKDWKRQLTPRWGRVWLDIGAGYLALGLTTVALVYLENRWPAWFPLWAVLGAIFYGYWIAYVQLFLHEAAHFNIAPTRRLNDALATIFLGLMVGQDVKAYRAIHFDHHRYLGTTRDTERTYFQALDLRFVIEGLLVWRLVTNLGRRGKHLDAGPASGKPAADDGGRRRRLLILAGGAALNLGIMLSAALTGHWAVALGWPLGMVSVHPMINATRQLLEHRSFDARAEVDYAATPHGAVSRMFGSGPLAATLGGAGFNRHLLHHWEPQISYTRLAEVERYLLATPNAQLFVAQTTSYRSAFRRLWLFNARRPS